MECSEELSKQLSHQTRSSCRVEPSRCFLSSAEVALEVVTSESRLHDVEQQATGTSEADVGRLHEEHQSRMHLLPNFQLGGT